MYVAVWEHSISFRRFVSAISEIGVSTSMLSTTRKMCVSLVSHMLSWNFFYKMKIKRRNSVK